MMRESVSEICWKYFKNEQALLKENQHKSKNKIEEEEEVCSQSIVRKKLKENCDWKCVKLVTDNKLMRLKDSGSTPTATANKSIFFFLLYCFSKIICG
jgi:hypothetical protein